jgi:L-ascorbate metabolism protein UlaG (beta-lactamase superfamily)
MNATWLGQSGYLFESDGQRLLIDPFYSDIVETRQGLKRLMAPPIPLLELRPDVIFITHNHLDHFDPVALPELHQAFPGAKIAGPESVMRKALELEFNRDLLVAMPKGVSHRFGAFSLRATPAYHSDPTAVGCLLKAEGKRIYLSGDTLRTETLVDEIRAAGSGSIDCIFIVINDRLGNMTLAEATYAVNDLQPKLAVPMHYGMFAENTADPHAFADACHRAGIPVHVPALGAPFPL